MTGTFESAPSRVQTNRSLWIQWMDVSDHPAFDGHEEVVQCYHAESGLRAIIAIHSTRPGPALGGCRTWNYADTNEALTDVLRLSQGMSYKHVIANTGCGGGKAVIVGDPRQVKAPELLQAFGQFVQVLSGRYVTAEDVGTSVDDMVVVREETPHVAGLPVDLQGSGDPSPFTAYGVFCGIRAAVAFRRGMSGSEVLRGVRVAVQGLGHVGSALCRYLTEAGARLMVTDVHRPAISRAREEFGATAVEPDEIFDVEADVLAPCALGAILTSETVNRLKAGIVAGAANNQLSTPVVAELLQKRGILYAPDFVINAGGVINIAQEQGTYNTENAKTKVALIADRLTEIFRLSLAQGKTTADVANAMAWAKLYGQDR